jgi:hypothetical protein
VGSKSEQATEELNTQIRGKRIRKAGRRSGKVGRDVACRGLVKRANGQRCEGGNRRRYQAIYVQVSRSSRKRNKD